MLVSVEVAEFCAAAIRLGERSRLLTASPGAAGGTDYEVCAGDFAEEWLDGASLLHLTGGSLRREPGRGALEAARRRGVLVALDLSDVAQPDARLALDLALARPDILLVREQQVEPLGVPLEGLARLPVLLLGDRGCQLFGRRVPAPPGAGDLGPAFIAALCSAYLDGAMPVEAAARAMVFAAAS